MSRWALTALLVGVGATSPAVIRARSAAPALVDYMTDGYTTVLYNTNMTRKTLGGSNTPVAISEIVEGVVVPITTTTPIDVTIPTSAPLTVTQIGTGGVDAFARQRFSQPATLFDSKQIFDNDLGAGNENQPLFWDNQATVGSGTSSTYSRNRASTILAVSDQTAGTRVRQTRRRFNYQPGKALRHGEPVLTPRGWVSIENIKLGDIVFDGTGAQTVVVGVYPQGKRLIYRITFDDGTHVDADGEHLWKTIIRQNKHRGETRVLTTNQMLAEHGPMPPQWARWRVPGSPILEIPTAPVPIDPYTLGAILGGGHISKETGFVDITAADEEILEYLICNEITNHKQKYHFGLLGLGQAISELGLKGATAIDKYVPDSYLFNDYNTRLSILRGLMDTNGTVSKKDGTTSFASISREIAENVAFLVRSIGGQAKIKTRNTFYKNGQGEKVYGKQSYRVRVISPINPFKLKRKANLWRPRTRTFDRYIHKIEPLGEFEATCIRVESEDHTFLTRNNVVTHNSQLAIITFTNLISGTGITKRIGGYDGTNGIFLQHANGVAAFGVRSYVTGAAVDTLVTQANWSLDTMDGNGPSGITLDFSKSQIFFYDYEWLGVGRVRLGFFVDGSPYYAHEFLHTNILIPVYMSTPNVPIRAEISNDGTGGADSFEVICVSVISEGGQDRLGMYRSIAPSTWATNIINANTVGTTYAIGGIRLKTTHLGLTVDITSIIGIATTSDDYILSLHFNPTLSAAPSFANVGESGIQYALGATTNPGTTLTDPGYTLMSRVVSTDVESINIAVENAVRLGANIASTPDEIWLAVTPLGANLDILGAINWQEQL